MASAPLRLAVVAVAGVAVHLHQRALVVDERVRLAERAAEQRLLPVRDLAVRRGRVDRPALTAVARRCSRTSRWDGVFSGSVGWVRNGSSAFSNPFQLDRLVAGDAAVGAAERRAPRSAARRADTVRALSAPNFSATMLLELALVVAPVVRAIARRRTARDDDQQHPDDGQHRPVDARIRRVGALFHRQILAGTSGQACHGQ